MQTGLFLLVMIACSLVLGSIFSFDVYHTTFFSLILMGLCVNTALCSAGRLWRSRRSAGAPPNFQNGTLLFDENVRGKDPVIVCTALERMLKSAGFRTVLRKDTGCYTLYGERGISGAWGMFSTHMSVVFIAAGVLYGAYAGYDATAVLTEGSKYTVTPASGQTFALWLNKFSTNYYIDGTVSDWISDVTVEQNGQIMVRRDIKVNHPLSFRGVKVYLASQGVLLQARVLDSDNKLVSDVEVAAGDKVDLPGTEGHSLRILRYIPDYDPLQPLVSKTTQPRNPYVVYAVYREGEPETRRVAPLNEPQPVNGGRAFVMFPKVRPVVGLHIKYDPGLPFVWVGFGLLALGCYFIYCTSHRQLWIRMTQAKNNTLAVSCAGCGTDLTVFGKKIHDILTTDRGL